jgi:signal transduction histidine kinase
MIIGKKTRQALLVFAGFAAILLIFGSAASISLSSMNSVTLGMEYLVKDLNAKYALMTHMRDATRERMFNVFALGYVDDPFEIEAHWESLSNHAQAFLKAREALFRLNLTVAQYNQLEKQKIVLASGQQIVNEVLDLVRQGRREEAWHKILETLAVNDTILRELSDMRDFQEQLAQQAMEQASADYHATRKQVFALVALAVVLSTLIAGLVVRRINCQQTRLTAALDQLEEAKEQLEERVKARTTELMEARDEALEASYTKSRFLANMSHELRTPLNAILGYCEMLKEECADNHTDPAMLDDLDKIHSAGRHLLELINDILDISKIEAGKVKLLPDYFSLSRLIDEVAHTMRPLMIQKDNAFFIELDPRVDRLYADQIRIRQVLLNLLSNANKFTEHGRITLEIAQHMENGETWVSMKVADTGIGISEENQQKLFTPFTQVDPSSTRKYGGTGLGLVISLRFCQLMGGKITVESQLGKGCRFTVWLPVHGKIQNPPGEQQRDHELLCMEHQRAGGE